MNPLTPERFMVDDALMEKDYDYMRRMAPDCAKEMYDMVEDVCDRLEYEGSFLYDEAPDKTTLLSLVDKIVEQLDEKNGSHMTDKNGKDMADKNGNAMTDHKTPAMKDFIQTMLCDEILYRRCRYYRKKKMFE